MTVFNRASYLQEAIDSVLHQTYPNFELILWDDGSTDGSAEIGAAIAQTDNRIHFVRSPHQGRVQSLIAAHALTQGDYLGWVDSDDRLMPTALAKTYQRLEQDQQTGLVYTQHTVIDAEGQTLGLGNRCQIPYSPLRMLVDFMTFHFRLFRKTAFEQAGGINPFFESAIDYDLCLRLTEVTRIAHISEPLYDYRVHPDSMSGQSRLKQTYFAAEAVQQAMERRGLQQKYALEIKFKSEFVLRALPQ